jgi:hypothetical protein
MERQLRPDRKVLTWPSAPSHCCDTLCPVFHCNARQPGVGGQAADILERAGLCTAADLGRLNPEQLSAAAPGLAPGLAARLAEWGRGRDAAAVEDKGPPKSIQVKGKSRTNEAGALAALAV